MKQSPKISELLPDIFKALTLIMTGTDPLIFSARVLFLEEAQLLPIVEGLGPMIDPKTKVRKYATIGGYSILDAIVRAEPRDYHKILWSKCKEMPVWVSSVKFNDSLDDLLGIFEKTRLGDVAVEAEGEFPVLISLRDIVSLYRVGRINSGLRVRDVGSEKVSISSDSSITGALRLMFRKKVRRLFVSGKDEKLRFVSDRNLIRFLLSPERLELVRKKPELWLDENVSNVLAGYATPVSDEATVNQASMLMGQAADDCLVCKACDKVVSRWDIVMQPWLQGKMEA